MTKAQIRMSRPPRESCSLAQRLQAANEAWQDFLFAQKLSDDGVVVEDSAVAFTAFSRFTHELVEDYALRKHLIHYFEERLRGRQPEGGMETNRRDGEMVAPDFSATKLLRGRG